MAIVDAVVDDHTIAFDLPLEAIGDSDGAINTAMVTGQLGPSDWAPDEGHGTIEPFIDAPWLSETPESGTIEPGESQVVTIHLGTPNLQPGEYHAPGRLLRPMPRSRPRSRSTSRSPSTSRRSSAP